MTYFRRRIKQTRFGVAKVLPKLFGLTILFGLLNCGGKPPRMTGKPIGPSEGPINVRQTFFANAVDPDGQDIQYRFDWGDGVTSFWTEPKPSGTIASDTHTFTTEGEKLIRAQAKDSEGKVSGWSEPKIFFATRDEKSLRRRFYCVNPEDEDTASFVSTPAIGDDGTIYVGCSFGHFHAIDSTGTQKAQFDLDPYDEEPLFISSPAIGPDGKIYVGAGDTLYAFNTALGVVWRFPTEGEILSSPAIGADGTIYILSEGNLYALSNQGNKLWHATGIGGYSSPAIGLDGSIYIGSDNGYLFCFRNNGTQKWFFAAGSQIFSSPALDWQGRVYFGTEDGLVFCLDSLGNEIWRYRGASATSSLVLDNSGNVYFGTEVGDLISLTPFGNERWVFSTGGIGVSTPAVRSDSVIYVRIGFGDEDSLFAVASNGTRRWAVPIGGSEGEEPIPSPTIANNGTVFISGGNAFYGFVGTTGGAATSAWPMFRRDAKHTGRLQ